MCSHYTTVHAHRQAHSCWLHLDRTRSRCRKSGSKGNKRVKPKSMRVGARTGSPRSAADASRRRHALGTDAAIPISSIPPAKADATFNSTVCFDHNPSQSHQRDKQAEGGRPGNRFGRKTGWNEATLAGGLSRRKEWCSSDGPWICSPGRWNTHPGRSEARPLQPILGGSCRILSAVVGFAMHLPLS